MGTMSILPGNSELEPDVTAPSPRRKGFNSQFGKLAIAVLADAVDIVRRGPDAPLIKSNCPCPRECRCYVEACAWLQNTREDGPFSLRGCCAWMTLIGGEFVDPVAIASRVRAGEDFGRLTRRIAGRPNSVVAHRVRAPRRKRRPAL